MSERLRGLCKHCGNNAEFYPSRPSQCIQCITHKNAQYQIVNRDKVRSRKKTWYEQNKDTVISKLRRYYRENQPEIRKRAKELRAANAERVLLQYAKTRARLLHLPFNITVEDIHIPAVCPVLGIELQPGQGKVSQHSPSLDRIESSLGYVRGNVRVISFRANSLKQDASVEEMKMVLEDIRRIHIGRVIDLQRAVEDRIEQKNNVELRGEKQ
jgi:hypothetical protein